jgi:hypothetical protein
LAQDVADESAWVDSSEAILQKLDRESGQPAMIAPERARGLERRLPVRGFDDPSLGIGLASSCDLDEPTHRSC